MYAAQGRGPTPIETRYAGHRFRSRLEARWAVFFDRAGLAWQYEPQGFVIGSRPYLPDFHLPGLCSGWPDVWVEVKGDKYGFDWELMEGAANELGSVLILNGIPDTQRGSHLPAHFMFARVRSRDNAGDPLLAATLMSAAFVRYSHTRDITLMRWAIDSGSDRSVLECPGLAMPVDPEITAAYSAARSARFEHGESG